MLIFAAAADNLQRAFRVGLERNLTRAVYVQAMFATGNDIDNRAVFKTEPADALGLVDIALHGPKKDVDRATKVCSLHP
jgi:hypothetical protein